MRHLPDTEDRKTRATFCRRMKQITAVALVFAMIGTGVPAAAYDDDEMARAILAAMNETDDLQNDDAANLLFPEEETFRDSWDTGNGDADYTLDTADAVSDENSDANLTGAEQEINSSAAMNQIPKIGDSYTFGSYEQDGDLTNGTEPLQWHIIDTEGENLLLLSDVCVDVKAFHNIFGSVTWEQSSVRQWLNSFFFNMAFDEWEKQNVIVTQVENSGNILTGEGSGNATSDQIFFLSLDEVNRYFFSNDAQKAPLTAYAASSQAEKQLAIRQAGADYCWWLRSPGKSGDYAALVDDAGNVKLDGELATFAAGVRPALWVRYAPEEPEETAPESAAEVFSTPEEIQTPDSVEEVLSAPEAVETPAPEDEFSSVAETEGSFISQLLESLKNAFSSDADRTADSFAESGMEDAESVVELTDSIAELMSESMVEPAISTAESMVESCVEEPVIPEEEPEPGAPSSVVVPVSPIRLSLKHANYRINTEGTLELTVLCTKDITENIRIIDERGDDVAYVANDGSGELHAEIGLFEKNPRSGELCARVGDYVSAPVSFSVVPPVTEEMITKLQAVGDDLADFVEAQNYEDAYSVDSLTEIAQYLNADSRILKAVVRDSEVLFLTKDNLSGSFAPPAEEGYTGFSSKQETFRKMLDSEDVSDTFLLTDYVRTNRDSLSLCPVYSADPDLGSSFKTQNRTVAQYTEGIGGRHTSLTDREAVEAIRSGDLLDYGFLLLMSHGSIRTSGMVDRLFFELLDVNRENGESLKDVLAQDELTSPESEQERIGNETSEWDCFWTENLTNCRLTYTISANQAEDPSNAFRYTISASSQYLMDAIGDRVFDNTIIYFDVCYAAADEDFRQFLLEHGAGIVIGGVTKIHVDDSKAVLKSITDALLVTDTSENARYSELVKVGDLAESELLAGIESIIQELPGLTEAELTRRYSELFPNEDDEPLSQGEERALSPEEQEKYADALKELINSLKYSYLNYYYNEGRRVATGSGSARGAIVYRNGDPVKDAELEVYYWQDHAFSKVQELKVEDGRYSLHDLPYGLYGLRVLIDGTEVGTMVAEHWIDGQYFSRISIGDPEVINNGHFVVRYNGKTYYFRMASDAYERSGLFGYFNSNPDSKNALIERDEDGNETVLTYTPSISRIYILDNTLYYAASSQTCSINLRNRKYSSIGSGKIIGYDEESGLIVLDNYGNYTVLDQSGEICWEISADRNYRCVALAGNKLYLYMIKDHSTMELYKADAATGSIIRIGSIGIAASNVNPFITCAVRVEEEIFFSYGVVTGTGEVFGNGGLARINTSTDWVEGLLGNVDYVQNDYLTYIPAIAGYGNFFAETGDDGSVERIYYCADVADETMGCWPNNSWESDYRERAWYFSNVYVFDVERKTSTATKQFFTRNGGYLWQDGSILAPAETGLEYTELISAADWEALGYPALEMQEEGSQVFGMSENGESQSCYYISDLELLDDEVWFTVSEIIRNPEADFGWRPGYDRGVTSLYRGVIGSGQFELIHSY